MRPWHQTVASAPSATMNCRFHMNLNLCYNLGKPVDDIGVYISTSRAGICKINQHHNWTVSAIWSIHFGNNFVIWSQTALCDTVKLHWTILIRLFFIGYWLTDLLSSNNKITKWCYVIAKIYTETRQMCQWQKWLRRTANMLRYFAKMLILA